jgi:hypothetical protein
LRKGKSFGEYIRSIGVNMSTLFTDNASVVLADETEATEELAWEA